MRLIWLGWMACLLSAQTARVGTFDKQSIVLAYYRSPLWAETLKSHKAAYDEAQRANDTQKVKELQDWGQKAQDLAHQQLAGKAPITNIVEALAPAFPEIARRAQVDKILVDPPTSAQTVDVTDSILDWLKADDNTRKLIQELKKH
jgi:hypothetical protein